MLILGLVGKEKKFIVVVVAKELALNWLIVGLSLSHPPIRANTLFHKDNHHFSVDFQADFKARMRYPIT